MPNHNSVIEEGVNTPKLDFLIGGKLMSEGLGDALVSVDIDNNLYLPDVATVKFVLDAMEEPMTDIPDNSLKNVMQQGAELVIKDGKTKIFDGEIISVSIEFNSIVPAGGQYAVVQAFDRSHRLHRDRKAETFVQMSISDIAKKVISGARLKSSVDSTSGVADYIMQANQTDWEFLWSLADRIGYEVYASGQQICFKKPRQSSGSPVVLEWGEELIQFRTRKSTLNQIPTVTVRSWDRDKKKAIIGKVTSGDGAPVIGDKRTGISQAKSAFGDSKLVVVDHPVSTQNDATNLARSISDSIAGEFIHAEGTTFEGMADLLPGVKVNITGLGENSGHYLVTGTTHVLNRNEGHRTKFQVGGRNPQTISSSLGSAGKSGLGLSRISGVVLGLVTNNNDPDGLSRVKIEFPWMGDKVETDWSPVAAVGAGKQMGLQWIPAVGDQVIVCFEHGDVNRPYVLGSLWSGTDKPPETNKSVVGSDGKVDLIEIKSREGQTFKINDKPKSREIGISGPTNSGKIIIKHDDKSIEIDSNGDVTIKGTNKITVEGKDIDLKSSGNLTLDASSNITLKAGRNLSLKGLKADLEGSQSASVKGAQAALEGSGMTTIKGGLVKIN